jgi:hypothetical protein
MENQEKSAFNRLPRTKPGKWAGGLLTAFAGMFILNSAVFMQMPSTSWGPILLPFYGILMLICGLASGILGLIAILKRRDLSWLVWLSILPGAFVIFMLLGEFLFPH